MTREFEGKKLLFLGGNPETALIVEHANEMGIKTIVASARHEDAAKKVAWKASDVDGMDVPGLIELAKAEAVDGVLVGVADILVPSYCKVCKALDFPCYATEEIIQAFSFKDTFNALLAKYGMKSIPAYELTAELREEDLAKIKYPVMVKPVDNGGGIGISVCYNESELRAGVAKALANSHKKRFIVERFMAGCVDFGVYFTFKDGYYSVSATIERHTTDEQPGLSRVNLGCVYDSKYTDMFMEKYYNNFCNMFNDLGVKNGVFITCAFYEDGEFYFYDPGFRLQGGGLHYPVMRVKGFDQRELLIRFALTGSEGDIDLKKVDDLHFFGKAIATPWFLLKPGKIARIEGLDEAENDPRAYFNMQRLFVGDTVPPEWIGTEKQVLTRLFLCCDTWQELAETIKHYHSIVKVYDENGNNMLLKGFDVDEALKGMGTQVHE